MRLLMLVLVLILLLHACMQGNPYETAAANLLLCSSSRGVKGGLLEQPGSLSAGVAAINIPRPLSVESRGGDMG